MKASSISQDGAGKRLVSEDRLRWTISRNQKRQLGDHRFEKQRVHGKAAIFAIQQSEETAREFVFGK